MIPFALVQAGLQLGAELLKAWNALKPEQRDAIVDRWLKDDAKRRSDWEKFTAWLDGLFKKVSF